MMEEQHPTFLRPVIHEMLCEIYYEGIEDWDGIGCSNDYHTKLNSIEDDMKFYFMPQVTSPEFTLNMNGLSIKDTNEGSPFMLRSKDDSILIQLKSGLFTLNILGHYHGWEEVKKTLKKYFELYNSVQEAQKITRVGLRYINIIPKGEAWQNSPNECIKASGYLAENIVNAKKANATVAIYSDENRWDNIRYGLVIGKKNKQEALRFDIDCIATSDETPWTIEEMFESVLEELHDREWEIFKSSITPKLIAYMENT